MIEIDGPKTQYFLIGSNSVPQNRVIYRTLAVRGRNPNLLVKHLENKLSVIRNSGAEVLYWRTRPSLTEERDEHGEVTGLYSVYCRLETLPKQTDEVWDDLKYHPEGAEVEFLDDQ